jgi:hypothetical protein
MNIWAVDPNLPLELLNGGGMVVEFFFLGWMCRYLWKETRRRKLGFLAWSRGALPPSMNFALAVVVFDIGVWVRSVDIWVWRRFFGAAAFNLAMIMILAGGAVAILLGSLCKVRAITKPDFGNSPWLISLAATVAFIAGSLLFR